MNIESSKFVGEEILFSRKNKELKKDSFVFDGEPLEKIPDKVLQIESEYRTTEDETFFSSLDRFRQDGVATLNLQNPHFSNARAIGGGTTETLVIDIADSEESYLIKPEFVAHIHKDEPRDTIHREKSAYIADRMLGINRKPPVELGNIQTADGKKYKCSIQRFESGAKTFFEIPPRERSQIFKNQAQELEQIAILDLVIYNKDGNPNNLLFSEDGIVPIDHANAYEGEGRFMSFAASMVASNRLENYPADSIGDFSNTQPEIAARIQEQASSGRLQEVTSLLVSQKHGTAIQDRVMYMAQNPNIRDMLLTIKHIEAQSQQQL